MRIFRQSDRSAAARRVEPARSRFRHVFVSFVICVTVTHVVSSVSQSMLVMRALEKAGAQFPLGTRLQVIGHDILGLIFFGSTISIGGCLLAGMLVALPCAAAVTRLFRVPAIVTFPLAGAASVAVILAIIRLNFFYNMTFLEGARGTLGYVSQLVAGALGGAVFALLAGSGIRRSR